MEDKLGKGKKVLECVLEYMREKGATLLPFINYSLEKNNLTFIAEKEDGAYAWPVLSFDYQPDRSLLALRFCFPFPIPNEKIPKALEILNLLNNCNFEPHFSLSEQTGLIAIHEGMFVTGVSLDKDAFKVRLGRLLKHARRYQALFTDKHFPDVQILNESDPKQKGESL